MERPAMARDRSAHHTLNGYKYQFDKSILVIASCTDPQEEISLEDVEDIDRLDELIQCKYHASQKFTPSAIRKPLTEFLRHYQVQAETAPKYRLYAHFGTHNRKSDQKLTVDEVLRVFGATTGATEIQIDDALAIPRAAFDAFVVGHLVFEVGPDIAMQEQSAKSAICTLLSCDSVECDLLHYNSALAVIFEIARQSDKARKRTTQQEFTQRINTRSTLFNHWLARLRSQKEYIEHLRDQLHTQSLFRASRWRAVVFAAQFLTKLGIGAAADLIAELSRTHFAPKISLSDATPLTFILEANAATLMDIKANLVDKGVPFNDGYESIKFSRQAFDQPPLINLVASRNGRASNVISKAAFAARVISLTQYTRIVDELETVDTVVVFSPDGSLAPPCRSTAHQFVIANIDTAHGVQQLLKKGARNG